MEYTIQEWLDLFLGYVPEKKLVLSGKMNADKWFEVGWGRATD